MSMIWQIDLDQIGFLHPILRAVLRDKTDYICPGKVTSLYRIGDEGVHGTLPLRALDEGCRLEKLGKVIEKYINDRWVYDPDRPEMKVCILHDVGQGLHLHYQVHPKTVMRQASPNGRIY